MSLGFDALDESPIAGLPSAKPTTFGTALGTCFVEGFGASVFSTYGTALGIATAEAFLQETFTEAVLSFMTNAAVPETAIITNAPIVGIGTF